ncbi:hypothetical protein [Mesoplasma melaleucae]|uniref:Uncharacterized protein n=1 Tax=Mesoplasma melaleucae TaxID=81459 RepID=A0A2K8NYR9_9MOLU|nr:hypothetical protein [Mesoplasma melaleucae]ATZ17793.1 hypothetical protein EMELA_v1c02200 [Mesoplasma melaleucae]
MSLQIIIGIAAGIAGAGLMSGILLMLFSLSIKKQNRKRIAKEIVDERQNKAYRNAVIELMNRNSLLNSALGQELTKYNLTDEEKQAAILAINADLVKGISDSKVNKKFKLK